MHRFIYIFLISLASSMVFQKLKNERKEKSNSSRMILHNFTHQAGVRKISLRQGPQHPPSLDDFQPISSSNLPDHKEEIKAR